ncbi:DUF354 domain-containing protein [Methanofollis formosanus]|uniref:DUF354 domain-containing protein n=1 Tax=Methanofollis formosanus TaxID=299308 RepID=A0A8G1A2D8_9EURY|nr:DUF354 domain-containing protein [Methanofollis formosanus]QYZ79820.1 DUF354 domain-containing protein [Methanofollis formosanus]
MKILFNVAHPAQVHLFRNALQILMDHGHECRITAINKEVSLKLLDSFGFDYDVVGSAKPTLSGKALELLQIDAKLYQIARSFRPDILVGGVGNAYVAHVGKLIRKPSIIFDDTEHAKIQHSLTDPFVSAICTPSCYRGDLGPKQIRYNGYHELAYLHPNHFTPNPAVLDEIGLTEDDPFIIVRFVSWNANHDVGQHGICDKVGLVKALEQYGRVLITSEGALPEELEPYQIRVSPEKLHDLLYYATLYVGEGGTTASEAATLGTHVIHISTTAKYCGIFCDLNQHGLLWTSETDEETIKKAIELLQDPDLKSMGQYKRHQLNREKIDVTAFMVWFIENYPESVRIMKENSDFQNTYPSGRKL